MKKLRKYYRTDDLEAAKQVLAMVRARVNSLEDEFERAQEAGVLQAEIEQVIDEDEYLRQHGVDPDEVDAAGERADQSPERSRSKKQIVRDGIEKLEDPTREAVIEYAEEHDVSPDWVERFLEKSIRKGEISEPGYHQPLRLL